MAYQDQEKRDTSFKHVANIQHTSVNRAADAEALESRHPIFSDRLLSEIPGISQDGLLDLKIARIRTWTAADSFTNASGIVVSSFVNLESQLQSLYSGSFVETYNKEGVIGAGSRPDAEQLPDFQYVEKIIMPLVADVQAVAGSNGFQFFLAIDWSDIRDKIGDVSQDANFTFNFTANLAFPLDGPAPAYPFTSIPAGYVQRNGSRLTNWLFKQGFGSDYQEQVFNSNIPATGKITRGFTQISLEGQASDDDESLTFYGGRGFDPAGGTVQVGVGSDNLTVQLKGGDGRNLTTPLWIEGYRYFGPTGSAAAGTITSNTSTSGNVQSAGIITTIFSNEGNDAQEQDQYDYYEDTTLKPTNSDDVLQYNVTSPATFTISSSIGVSDHIIHLGSSSYYGSSGSFSTPRYDSFSQTTFDDFGRGGSDVTFMETEGNAVGDESIIDGFTTGKNIMAALRISNTEYSRSFESSIFSQDATTFTRIRLATSPNNNIPWNAYVIDWKPDEFSGIDQVVIWDQLTINVVDPEADSFIVSPRLRFLEISGSNGNSNGEYASGSAHWSPIHYQLLTAAENGQGGSIGIDFDAPAAYKYYRITIPQDSIVPRDGFTSDEQYEVFIHDWNWRRTNRVSTTYTVDAIGSEGAVNGGNLFAFNTGSGHRDLDFSNYGQFYSPTNENDTSHEFAFNSRKQLHSLGVYFSHQTASIPTTESIFDFPNAVTLYGSEDEVIWTQIGQETNLDHRLKSGSTGGPISYNPTSSFYEHSKTNLPDHDSRLSNIQLNRYTGLRGYDIAYVTMSIQPHEDNFYHYKLEVSGGIYNSDLAAYQQNIHAIDIFENKEYGLTNRKQINIGVNKEDSGQASAFGGNLTKFEQFLSASMVNAGIAGVSSDFTVFEGGAIIETLSASADIDLQGFRNVTASIISASTIVGINELSLNNLSAPIISASSQIITNQITSSNNIRLESGSLNLSSNNEIFFTNRKFDGSPGSDDFSSRIFGHSTNAGVNDLYLDAYRIYNVTDAQYAVQTLHPFSGSIKLHANEIILSGSVQIGGENSANVRLDDSVTLSNGSTTITGNAGKFGSSDVNVGDAIRIASASFIRTYVVEEIQSSNLIVLNEPWEGNATSTAETFIDNDLLTVKNSAGKVSFKVGKSGDISASSAISASNIFLSEGSQLDVGTGTNRSSIRGGQISAPTVIATSTSGITTTAITASGNISASGNLFVNSGNFIGTLSIPGVPNVSASIAAAVAGGDNLGNHTATQDLNLNGNDISNILNITASNNISSSGVITATSFVGDGSSLSGISATISATAISGAFNGQTGSFITNSQTSSFLVPSDTGSFALAVNVVANSSTSSFLVPSDTGSFLTSIPINTISSSAQIATNISGSFNLPSSSFSTRVTTLEGNTTSTPIGTYSSSLQTLGNITSSGNIITTGIISSSTLSGTNTGDQDLTLFAKNSITASLLVRNTETGSFALTANVVANSSTASFVVNSQTSSFSTITQLNASGSTLQTNINAKATTGSNVIFRNVTASFNISASGTIIASNLSGINTGDEDLTSYIQNSQTSSFLVPSDTGSFALTNAVVANSSTASFVVNSQTGSFLTSVPVATSGLKSLNINASAQTGSLTVGPAARQIELRGGSTFTSTNPRILSSTGIIEVEDSLQMNSAPIYFHEGATNSYIGVDVFTPDNLEIHANQDLELIPDDNLIISSSTSAKTIHYNKFEVLGDVSATAFTGSLTAMTGIIDGGTF